MQKPLYLAKCYRGFLYETGNDLEALKAACLKIVSTRTLPNGLASCHPHSLSIYNQARELVAVVEG